MASYFPSLSSLNPINSFPAYHGPYDVGTIDVEVPCADLPQPSATVPEDATSTVSFRVFYPCHKPGKSESARPVRWIPQPQKATMHALMSFLGAGAKTAAVLSWLPQNLFWIKIPAYRNARILEPKTSNGRWPVTVFSHGLAGSRNAYSYICGDMASKGMVVIALDHRDGSSPVQFVRETADTPARIVEAVKISHTACPETFEGRDKQLRIRLWEACAAFEALVKIDAGERVNNLDDNTSNSRKERREVLEQFKGSLDIHRPGKVAWAGHSFGGATTVQLLKSVYYQSEMSATCARPLIELNSDAAITCQISPESPALLLDIWCLPLQSPDQKWLWDRPLPTYVQGGPMGDNILSVLSEGFFKWKGNCNTSIEAIAPPTHARQPSASQQQAGKDSAPQPQWSHLRASSPSSSANDSGYNSARASPSPPPTKSQRSDTDGKIRGPHMFYPTASQHFSQSDFGVLFPWLTSRLAKAEEPERLLDLNVRAMVQVARNAGIAVVGSDDREILDPQAGVRGWVNVDVRGGKEEEMTKGELDVEAVRRRLSVGEEEAPRDEVGMGAATVET